MAMAPGAGGDLRRNPPRLSSPLGALKPHYDVVVVGSGYGGAVTAARLAEGRKLAGGRRTVCVLERGRELQSGDYPDTLERALREFQVDTPDRHLFSPSGLYDLRINREMSVFLGCGLGGTSLINANVVLMPPAELFKHAKWPAVIQQEANCGTLWKWFEKAEGVLRPEILPEKQNPRKLRALQRIQESLEHATFARAPVTVKFRETGMRGKPPERATDMFPCTACGDCVSGCNYGAKRTLITSYLPLAWWSGAQIFTEVKVQSVEPYRMKNDDPNRRWIVHFDHLGSGREHFTPRPLSVTAHTVVLAAGALGSPEILMRSQAQRGLRFSGMLGKRFSGNGDVLAFSYKNRERVDGVGFGAYPPEGSDLPGPCISGYVKVSGERSGSELLLEDAVIPGALSPILALGFMLIRLSGGAARRASDRDFSIWQILEDTLRGGVNSTQTYLAMVEDRECGKLIRRDDRVRVLWPRANTSAPYREFERLIRDNAKALGGSYVPSPLGPVTVHPLGGCVMGDDSDRGAVDDTGAVFDPRGGVHAGLHVCDASVIPVPLLTNPLLTITALSERAAYWIAQRVP